MLGRNYDLAILGTVYHLGSHRAPGVGGNHLAIVGADSSWLPWPFRAINKGGEMKPPMNRILELVRGIVESVVDDEQFQRLTVRLLMEVMEQSLQIQYMNVKEEK